MDDKDAPEEVNFREAAFAIPLDILDQKLLLHKGLIMKSQGEQEQAQKYFLSCLNRGAIYDPRNRLECANQLRFILAQDSIVDLPLERLAECFRFRNRDFIFLVNQSPSMAIYKEQVA